MSNNNKDNEENKQEELNRELSNRVEDKGKELQDVLAKYSSTVGKWQATQNNAREPVTDVIKLDDCENIILILGNILNPDGSPHEWIIQRVDHSFKMLEKYNLDLNKTCFLVSGGDASNQKYTYDAEKWKDVYKNAPHDPESQVMSKLLQDKHKVPKKNITLESQARTTLENFYYAFKILYKSDINKLKNFICVTSDWHCKRSKTNFDILYSVEQELKDEMSIEDDIVTRKYKLRKWFKCDNISFEGAVSGAPQTRFAKEVKLIAAKWVYPQAKEYSDYIWEWRDYNDEQNRPALKKQSTLGAFAFSTAIEHLYLRLDGAEHGLVKVPDQMSQQ